MYLLCIQRPSHLSFTAERGNPLKLSWRSRPIKVGLVLKNVTIGCAALRGWGRLFRRPATSPAKAGR